MFRLFALVLLLAAPLSAQERTPSHCHAFAEAPGVEFIQLASFGQPLPDETVRLSYVDHSTYLLESPSGFSAATDYTGFLGPTDHVPTVVTMNHAHTSHWTSYPDPRIPHVLKGWGDANGPAKHNLDLGEVLIRNVPTDIRSRFGGPPEKDGNSIFIFELAGLCIGHLGHLHHEPTPEQYASIGRLDVVMAAIDGGMSLDTDTMTRVINRFRSSIVLPMHWRTNYALDDFLGRMSENFDVVRFDGSSIEVSLKRLPSNPQILVLQPKYINYRGLDD